MAVLDAGVGVLNGKWGGSGGWEQRGCVSGSGPPGHSGLEFRFVRVLGGKGMVLMGAWGGERPSGMGVGRLSFGEGAYAQEMVALDPGVALTGGVGLGQVTETLSVGLQDPSLPC